MIRFFYLPLICLLLLLSKFNVQAQKIDSLTFLETSVANARALYGDKYQKQDKLVNGKEYIDYDNRIKGYPYFGHDGYLSGSITYQGNHFDEVELKYDIHKNMVILKHYDQNGYGTDVYLVNEWIDSFQIDVNKFVKLFTDDKNSELEKGFYHILHDGSVKLISRREKKLIEDISVEGVSQEFFSNDKYYLLKDGDVIKMKNRRSLIKAFPEQKKQMKKYINANRQAFNTNFERAIITALHYYENLEK